MGHGTGSVRKLAIWVLRELHLLRFVRRALGREDAHGHALLIKLLSSLRNAAGSGYLIEVGTTREKVEGQGSTVQLAAIAQDLGLRFITIDMDPANTQQAELDLRRFVNASAVS